MRELVENDAQIGFGKRLQTIDQDRVQFRPIYEQAVADAMRPVNIQITINRDDSSKDKPAFSIIRSKFAWLLATLAISLGLSYSRSRYVCQGFKDSGRFYYGMDVNRCVGILIKEPFANLEQQLSAVNNRY